MTEKLTELYKIIKNTLQIELPKIFCDYLEKGYDENYDYSCIYSIGSIVERNMIDEITLYAPGFIIIGDDNGDCRYLMKSGADEIAVYAADAGDLKMDCHRLISEDFAEWQRSGFKPPCELTLRYDVVMRCFPDGGLKELLKIKSVLELKLSANELLRIARGAPVTLLNGVNEGKTLSYKKRLGDCAKYFDFVASGSNE